MVTSKSDPNLNPVSQLDQLFRVCWIEVLIDKLWILISVIRPVVNQRTVKKTDPVAKWGNKSRADHLERFIVFSSPNRGFCFLISAGISTTNGCGTCLNFQERWTGQHSARRSRYQIFYGVFLTHANTIMWLWVMSISMFLSGTTGLPASSCKYLHTFQLLLKSMNNSSKTTSCVISAAV